MALPTYDKSKRRTSFEQLPKGAYVIKIMGAKEDTWPSGDGVIKIAFDIAEGEYKGFYQNQFDKNTKTFSTDYAGHEVLDRANIKGVGNFDEGSFVFIYPDGAFKTWTSQTAVFFKGGKELTITSTSGHFYKIRVWDTRYQ
jgi:hypothetical protein